MRRGDESAHAAAERLAERAGDDVDARSRAGQRRRAAALLAEMSGRVAVVDQDERAVAVGERADLPELRDMAVHREDAVGRDQLEPRTVGLGLLQPVLELVHVGIGEAVASRLGQPDAVDDRGVVEAVGDDRVLFAHQRLEHAAVGVEAGGEHDRVVLAEVFRDRQLELAMQRLRPADEPNRGHAEAERVHRLPGRGDDLGMVGEAEVIVGAEIDHVARAAGRGDADMSALRAGEQALALEKAGSVDLVEGGADVPQERVGHGASRICRDDSIAAEDSCSSHAFAACRRKAPQAPQSTSASPRWIASASSVSRPSASCRISAGAIRSGALEPFTPETSSRWAEAPARG